MDRRTRTRSALLVMALLVAVAGCGTGPQTGEFSTTRTCAPEACLIPDNDPAGLVVAQAVQQAPGPRLTGVVTAIKITHPRPGDLDLSLVHPDGTAVHLRGPNPSDTSSNV